MFSCSRFYHSFDQISMSFILLFNICNSIINTIIIILYSLHFTSRTTRLPKFALKCNSPSTNLKRLPVTSPPSSTNANCPWTWRNTSVRSSPLWWKSCMNGQEVRSSAISANSRPSSREPSFDAFVVSVGIDDWGLGVIRRWVNSGGSVCLDCHWRQEAGGEVWGGIEAHQTWYRVCCLSVSVRGTHSTVFYSHLLELFVAMKIDIQLPELKMKYSFWSLEEIVLHTSSTWFYGERKKRTTISHARKEKLCVCASSSLFSDNTTNIRRRIAKWLTILMGVSFRSTPFKSYSFPIRFNDCCEYCTYDPLQGPEARNQWTSQKDSHLHGRLLSS